jgi:hypothetical protein
MVARALVKHDVPEARNDLRAEPLSSPSHWSPCFLGLIHHQQLSTWESLLFRLSLAKMSIGQRFQ